MSLDALFLLDLGFFGVDEFVAVADGDLAVFVVPDCAIVSEAEKTVSRKIKKAFFIRTKGHSS